MKWVKVAIGAVIAIISIGIIATSVYNMTQETVRDEVVTFEVLTETTVTSGTYDKLLLYSEIDNQNVINVKSVLINGIESNDIESGNVVLRIVVLNDTPAFIFYGGVYDQILINDELSISLGFLALNDMVEIIFEVTQPPQLTGITATLILLTPLIFAGGVLAYLLNKQNY